MKRLGSRWRPLLDRHVAEEARDLIARAQAALGDQHRAGAERQFVLLYDVLVPTLDDWALCKSADAQSVAPGLLDLWHELVDIDGERESIEEVLLWHAGHRDDTSLPPVASAPAQSDAERTAQREWLAQALHAAPAPQSKWWRRLTRRAQGPLADCAHLSVQRGAEVLWERPPPIGEGGSDRSPDATTALPALQAGDRLTLRFPVPAPGRVLVLHAIGDAHHADLEQLLPDPDDDLHGEGVPRRKNELIEVVGEVAPAVAESGGHEHSLILLWGPELLSPSWGHEVLARGCLPVGSRAWRYTYTVEGPALPPPSLPVVAAENDPL